MAIKFSQFNLRTDHTSGMYLVGYDGNQNIHITVDNLFDDFINGTPYTIPMFDDPGTALTDSIITQSGNSSGNSIGIAGAMTVTGDATFSTNIEVEGTADFNGDVNLGDESTDLITQNGTLYLNGPIKDTTDTLGTADQILVSDVNGELTFTDLADIAIGSAEVVEVPVKNLQGSLLTKGDPVYISGSVGASGRLEVQLADASNEAKMPAVGLLKQDLGVDEEGFAVVTGKLRNLPTSPIDGQTPLANDVIYVKASGTTGAALTLTKPTGSDLIQNMGKVGRVSTSNDGTFVVSSILRTNDIPNLTPGKIWVGSTGNTIESTVVSIDEANDKVTIAGDLTLERDQSDTTLTLISDGSNQGENNNPSIKFIQDGGAENAAIGFNIIDDTSVGGNGNRFWIVNAMDSPAGEGGITFGTAQVDGWDNAVGRFMIRGDGKGLFGHPDSLYNKALGSQFEIYDNRNDNTTTDASFTVYSVLDYALPSGNEGAGGIKQILDVYNNGVLESQEAIMFMPGTQSSDFAASTPIAFYTDSDMDTVSPSGFAGKIFNSGNWLLDGSGTSTDADPGYQLKVAGTGLFTDQVTIPETPLANTDAASKAYVDTKVDGTGTTQTLPVWSDGPNGVLGDSPIKVVQSTSTPSPTFGENILIGSTLDLAVESKKTLQIGDDNIIGSLLGKTKNSLLVGQENSIIASATKSEIINSAVVGLQNEVTANNSLVAGRLNVVQSNASFVAGSSNVTSSEARQFVIGRENTVDSEDAVVLGDSNTVAKITPGHKGAMVFGNLNNILGDRILCLGTSNTATSDNQNTFIIGKGNTSTANNSYSIGFENSISGNDSYTLGKLNTLASPSSVAIGIGNELNGEKAYAFGNNNSNIGIESFAIGRQNNGLKNDGVSAASETYLIGFENKLVTDNTIILGRFSDHTVLSTDSTEERSTIAFAVGASDSKRRTAWEFRGRSKNEGNTRAGDSMRIMAWALLYSTSYADDTAAAAGGVERGQLYRTGSTVKIRMI